eukprot:jgi/Chrzof1/1960/Cz10g28010.t1
MRTCGRSVGTKIALGCGGSTHTAASTSWVLRAFRHSILLASLADVEEQQLYDYALKLSREEDYKGARQAFEVLLRRYPFLCKAWVSYAQMEKRIGRRSDPDRMEACRVILQRGLQLNPSSACLAQAWGLMELQKGNFWAAVRLLERCVTLDPSCSPVLKWKPVDSARKTVGSRTKRLNPCNQAST